MEANNFIARLKANGYENDWTDLDNVYSHFKDISAKLTKKDKEQFSVNVLCLICRNIEKVPSWCKLVDKKVLVILSIDCVRETRGMSKQEQVKTLACIYHIHRYAVKQTTPIPPELVLKLSLMPFEGELMKEYCKTYWNIIADRLLYFEKLKLERLAIVKLLPKLTEDILSVVVIFDIVPLCNNILTFLIKKLHALYSDGYAKELNVVFRKIFECLTKKSDETAIQKLSEKETIDLYVKFNDCFYVVAENTSKVRFRDSSLNSVVRSCTTLLGHRSDMFHCLQTFYQNCFCCILVHGVDLNFTANVLKSLLISLEMTEKMGYSNAMRATQPFLNQFLRLYLEYSIANSAKMTVFNEQIQNVCMEIMLLLTKKGCVSEQIVKCDNCTVRTSLHDSLRLLFITKHFITISLSKKLDVTKIMETFNRVVAEQYEIITELMEMGCPNYDKYFRKWQTDIHNTAIALNTAQVCEFSIKLFDVYLKMEFQVITQESDLKNISRALYNKSICEMDSKIYENALKSAYLSLLFSQPQGLGSEKYMNLVMDLKTKFKNANNIEDNSDIGENSADLFQMTTVLDIHEMASNNDDYETFKSFLGSLKLSNLNNVSGACVRSALLKHEFSMYAKLWPSVTPIAGVWRALRELADGARGALATGDTPEEVVQTLCEVITETPAVVRTIHVDHFNRILTQTVEEFDSTPLISIENHIAHATMLLLKTEYDLSDASDKYRWKSAETNPEGGASRTVPQEYAATQAALQAVRAWAQILPELDNAPTAALRRALPVCEAGAAQLLHQRRPAPALQLVLVCCHLATRLADKEAYVRNASVIIRHARGASELVNETISVAASHWAELSEREETLDTALVFLCDTALHYARCGRRGAAGRLLRAAQGRLLATTAAAAECDSLQSVDLDMAAGRLLEAQHAACGGGGGGAGAGGPPSALAALVNIHRHYLAVGNTGRCWWARRARGLARREAGACAGVRAARAARALALWRRARAFAVPTAATAPAPAALAQAALLADTTPAHDAHEAQTKINNHLKYILGLQPSSENQPYSPATESESKQQMFTPKQDIELMLDCQTMSKRQTSPSVPCVSVPGFRVPEFFKHGQSCQCFACETPFCLILACQAFGLESSMYFRAKEYEIARNYFDGTLKCLGLIEVKLGHYFERLKSWNYDSSIIDIARHLYENEFKYVQLSVLIELSFFELAKSEYSKADEYIIMMHEIMQDYKEIDDYLRNEVINLIVASARLRKVVSKPTDATETGLEVEMENLKLSPAKMTNELLPSTPINNASKPPTITVGKIVDEDELPQFKRKVIKLNLDEDMADDEKETVKPKRREKKTEFKIPVLVTTKPVLEAMTPLKPTGATDMDKFVTPKAKDQKVEFFTPYEDPPEQFFTPMTSVKTYSKKNLRQNIVKELETEFCTPKGGKENSTGEKTVENSSKARGRSAKVETGSVKSLQVNRNINRATSPGKLASEVTTRSRRLRQPNFSQGKDDKK